ncbi:MAG: ribonuclease III [Actinobacteria bacterium]|nr:ribonuclease III [Actinomycetota bacterium]
MSLPENIAKAEKYLGIMFNNKGLLFQALTHRSYSFEKDLPETNEKLEFLGDSILNLLVTEYIYHKFPELNEGDLAKLRANIVNANFLAEIAQELHIGECILMGKGAEQTGGRTRVSILGDALEAIIGALYLDQGMEATKEFVLKNFKSLIDERASLGQFGDPKTRLQELVMATYGNIPRYRTVEEYGPVHDRSFVVKVYINDQVWGQGVGKSKKKAEQGAAKEALKKLREKQ